MEEEKTTEAMDENEPEYKRSKDLDNLLEALEVEGYTKDKIAEYFDRMIDHIEIDGSTENYWLYGFFAGLNLGRTIESNFQTIAMITASRKSHGDDEQT